MRRVGAARQRRPPPGDITVPILGEVITADRRSGRELQYRTRTTPHHTTHTTHPHPHHTHHTRTPPKASPPVESLRCRYPLASAAPPDVAALPALPPARHPPATPPPSALRARVEGAQLGGCRGGGRGGGGQGGTRAHAARRSARPSSQRRKSMKVSCSASEAAASVPCSERCMSLTGMCSWMSTRGAAASDSMPVHACTLPSEPQLMSSP